MAQYPMSPCHSRMLLTVIKIMKNQRNYARANLVLGYAIATASALSFPNPFNMQFGRNHDTSDGLDQEGKHFEDNLLMQQEKKRQEEKAMVREARARFCNPCSDALTSANALQSFELAADPFEFCQKKLLHLKPMDDMSKKTTGIPSR
ncbi:ATP-dependent RNA helicase DEAH13-like [Iris pallida]|uniref:ATP-dependent RNA helicase DEAH13-like n=1 Tax=Iris pallida TaxID=29817 RepID=A0AAX6HU34_IRIPA|nr:ATP-dependent RNA helicase DEAH13-like [Iris pallida]